MSNFKSMKNEPSKAAKVARPGELKSLEECWKIFRTAIPAGASDEQLHRAKMTFIAGAAFMFEQVRTIGEPHIDEDAGAAHLASIEQELHSYTNELGDRVMMDALKTRGRAH